ncbi:hypothetical protein A2160_04055 [Candidatus Beckwithbacteria bacterium RBG_13_42_9]|uniref:Uncharacterized protein n=1 Tax=Candidatus Beckwithbacteria bacterium RBG_13_42_9 TaxID=1797457 RepID=A0A1F5E354_9BACT|nr:MAG: hypothetical protein A2160_04055 [Candidatus Beckwithbacteria bacterium RBG_13_42_9]
MKKIETIWHYLLWSALEKREFKHTQQKLAQEFDYSLSTINYALFIPSQMGAIRKESKFFVLQDFFKLLYYWASLRNLNKDLIYQTYVKETTSEIEGLVPPESVYAGYSAARRILDEPPADYAQIHLYFPQKLLTKIQARFPANRDQIPNLFVFKLSPIMERYGKISTLAQTFVDIWNLKDWYSHDFTKALEEKIRGILS